MSPHVQLFNLAQFDETFLQPVLSRVRSRFPLAVLLGRSELIEVYFWLALGSEIKFFPTEDATRLARHRLYELFDVFKMHLSDYAYLFPSDFEIRLITVVRQRNYNRMLLPVLGQSFESPELLLAAFQSA